MDRLGIDDASFALEQRMQSAVPEARPLDGEGAQADEHLVLEVSESILEECVAPVALDAGARM